MSGRSPNQRYLDGERDREREGRILAMHHAGQTQKEIGAFFDVSPSRIGQILKRLHDEQDTERI